MESLIADFVQFFCGIAKFLFLGDWAHSVLRFTQNVLVS